MAAAAGLDASSLRHLPLEVLLRITDNLNTVDLGSLRLTCRAIEGFLDSSFVAEFFTRKQFMLTSFSLNALVDISKSRLGSHLRFLHIGLDVIPANAIHRHSDDTTELALARQRTYNDLVATQSSFRTAGAARDLLATAMLNLPNLEGIIIRDYNSRRRRRDGFMAEWKSYGNVTFYQQTGTHPHFGTDFYSPWPQMLPAGEAFQHILHACVKSGARPKAIEAITHRSHLNGVAFSMPPVVFDATPVIENLQKFHLSFKPERLAAKDQPVQTGHYDYLLYEFLAKAKNLVDLRVNQESRRGLPENDAVDYLLEWLIQAVSLKTAGKEPILPKLRHLSIGRFMVRDEMLLSFIRAFPALEGLELWRLNIYHVYESTNLEIPKESYWPRFLKGLRQSPNLASLRHFKADMMNQSAMSGSQGGPPGSACRVKTADGGGLEYTGPDFAKYLEEQEKGITVDYGVDYGRREGELTVLESFLVADFDEEIGYAAFGAHMMPESESDDEDMIDDDDDDGNDEV